MLFVIILFIVCVGGCWFVFKSIGSILFPDKSQNTDDNFIIHNHYNHTENHLHISENQLKELQKKKPTDT